MHYNDYQSGSRLIKEAMGLSQSSFRSSFLEHFKVKTAEFTNGIKMAFQLNRLPAELESG